MANLLTQEETSNTKFTFNSFVIYNDSSKYFSKDGSSLHDFKE